MNVQFGFLFGFLDKISWMRFFGFFIQAVNQKYVQISLRTFPGLVDLTFPSQFCIRTVLEVRHYFVTKSYDSKMSHFYSSCTPFFFSQIVPN